MLSFLGKFHFMLRYVTLCYTILYYTTLQDTIPYDNIHYHMCYAMLYCTITNRSIFLNILYSSIKYCSIL